MVEEKRKNVNAPHAFDLYIPLMPTGAKSSERLAKTTCSGLKKRKRKKTPKWQPHT